MAGAQQQAHGLISYFENLYEEKYKRKPRVNRHADKWGFLDVMKDLGEERIKEVLDFYFLTTNPRNHSLQYFFYNYHKLSEGLEAKEKDIAERKKLREESKRRAQERNDKS